MTAHDSDRLRSLAARIANAAGASGQDVQRVRRGLAFHRLLARMAGSGWVLKGGYCLEARLAGAARATKDIDFVRQEMAPSADDLLGDLDALLMRAPVDDGFTFDALTAKLLRAPEDPAAAWRVKVQCAVDGHPFETLTLDVVSQFGEVADAVEHLTIPPPVTVPGIGPVTVDAVDVHQHAAEKFHAIGRLYAGERPSSRVKDLVDLALLIEAGLLTDLSRLHRRLLVVHEARDGRPPTPTLPAPPAAWETGYARLVDDLDLSLRSVGAAFDRAHAIYHSALTEGPTR